MRSCRHAFVPALLLHRCCSIFFILLSWSALSASSISFPFTLFVSCSCKLDS
ncbi:hypothetical protein BCR44DRAFT_1425695, partial [Catenaria anguillulae PL171]